MLRKTAHFILYLSTLQKPAAGAGFCNVLKYKADLDDIVIMDHVYF